MWLKLGTNVSFVVLIANECMILSIIFGDIFLYPIRLDPLFLILFVNGIIKFLRVDMVTQVRRCFLIIGETVQT